MLFEAHFILSKYHRLDHWNVAVPDRGFWRLWWNRHEGASVITSDGKIPLSPDRFVLVAPHTEFSVELLNPTDHVGIHFELGDLFKMANPGVYTVDAAPTQVEALQRACELPTNDRRTRLLLLTEVISQVCQSFQVEVWREPIADQRIARVLEAMDENLQNPLSNRELADLAYMTPTAFIRRFKQVLGRSPQVFYAHRRLDQACLLLEKGDLSIDEISESCGFCDRNYFSTSFRKHFGISPAAFRRDAQYS